MKKLVCLWDLSAEQKCALEEASHDRYEVLYCAANEVTKEIVQSSEIIFGNAEPILLKNAPNLKWMQLNSAGADAYIVPDVFPEGAKLTNATGAYGQSVAEHMFAVMLMFMKKLHLYRDAQNKSAWTDMGDVTTPEGACVLIAGTGDIGTYFARLVKGVGAYTIGIKRNAASALEFFDEVHTIDRLDEMLERADVVVSVLPSNASTEGMWNKARFSRMKKSSFFLNAGRGSAVNSDDLYAALTEKLIAGAAIDVTVPEPLPADSKLWKAPNLILTPHVAGGYHLPETFRRIFAIALDNLKRFANGEALVNEVDFTTGYSKIKRIAQNA